VSMALIEIVVYYCSNLIIRVKNMVLQHIMPLNIEDFREFVGIYEQLRASSASEQNAMLATELDISVECRRLYTACREMEICMRLFLYARFRAEPSCLNSLRRYLQTTAGYSVQDNMERMLQAWTTAQELTMDHCKLTVWLVVWGDENFMAFGLHTNIHIASSEASNIHIDEDDSYPLGNYEYFTNIDIGTPVDLVQYELEMHEVVPTIG